MAATASFINREETSTCETISCILPGGWSQISKPPQQFRNCNRVNENVHFPYIRLPINPTSVSIQLVRYDSLNDLFSSANEIAMFIYGHRLSNTTTKHAPISAFTCSPIYLQPVYQHRLFPLYLLSYFALP